MTGPRSSCLANNFAGLERRPITHSWGKSRKGKDVVRQTTAKSRFARSLSTATEWCRTNRHRPVSEQRAWLSAALRGHYAYYGITGNYRLLQDYRYQVAKMGTEVAGTAPQLGKVRADPAPSSAAAPADHTHLDQSSEADLRNPLR
jgi:hypothetical protein